MAESMQVSAKAARPSIPKIWEFWMRGPFKEFLRLPMHMIISISIQTKGQVMLGYGDHQHLNFLMYLNLTRFLEREMLMAAMMFRRWCG